MDMYDFVSGGGLYKTSAGYSANVTTIKVRSGNTYPLEGIISFTRNYSINVAWDANGVVQYSTTTNLGLDLLPVFTIINYAAGQKDTLASYANVASWNAKYNIVNYARIIDY